jgi:hypothetical protein
MKFKSLDYHVYLFISSPDLAKSISRYENETEGEHDEQIVFSFSLPGLLTGAF